MVPNCLQMLSSDKTGRQRVMFNEKTTVTTQNISELAYLVHFFTLGVESEKLSFLDF